jgi:enamine deaminase RidA (YjgF/YER057c/UK114 family)
MLKRHNPATVAAPFSRYSHGVEAPDNARWLVISGQVGVTPEGKVLNGAKAQIEQAWIAPTCRCCATPGTPCWRAPRRRAP